ncbi:hypothetical protein V8C44DRAFT_337531 [Trichoderma aethiopicum]
MMMCMLVTGWRACNAAYYHKYNHTKRGLFGLWLYPFLDSTALLMVARNMNKQHKKAWKEDPRMVQQALPGLAPMQNKELGCMDTDGDGCESLTAEEPEA